MRRVHQAATCVVVSRVKSLSSHTHTPRVRAVAVMAGALPHCETAFSFVDVALAIEVCVCVCRVFARCARVGLHNLHVCVCVGEPCVCGHRQACARAEQGT
jgi:hypothetical protein